MATESVFATASPPAAVISATTSSRGSGIGSVAGQAAAGVVDDDLRPLRRQQEGIRAAQTPAAAGDDGDPIVESQSGILRSEHEAVQVALVAPLLQQVVEGVEARHIVVTEERPDTFAETAALVVVIAWRAGEIERRGVYRRVP